MYQTEIQDINDLKYRVIFCLCWAEAECRPTRPPISGAQ